MRSFLLLAVGKWAQEAGLHCSFTGFCHRRYQCNAASPLNTAMAEGSAPRVKLAQTNTLAVTVDSFEYASVASALLRYRRQIFDGGAMDKRDFVMVELGAGFGRWGLEAVHMGRRLQQRVRSIMVEADPTHLAWIKDAVGTSRTPLDQVCLQWWLCRCRLGVVIGAVRVRPRAQAKSR